MDPSFSMTIQSDISEIPSVSARLEEAMGAAGFSPEEVLDTQLAVEEIITNIIVHGYKTTGSEIRLSGRFSGNGIVLEVADSAPAFDPLSIPEPELDGEVDDRKIGGLGIYLVRQVMDAVSYRHEDGKNILVMEKRKTA